MRSRRDFVLASLGTLTSIAVRAAGSSTADDLDKSGRFERIVGRPGVVVGVPHATSDSGTLEAGRALCSRLNAGGVFVTGFWDATTRHRVNVNRDSEETIGAQSQATREWQTAVSVAATARYEALVKEAAQGPLLVFYELHSNHRNNGRGI
jgi:hypothetical protein